MTFPAYITYRVSSEHKGMQPTMASRMVEEPRRQDGFEVKGIILLALCGLYALILFMVAKLLSYIVGKITAPVKSIFFSASTTEVKPCRKPSVEIINTKLDQLRRTHTRSFNHG